MASSGTVSWKEATFNWTYVPTYQPVNSSFNNYTILLDGHSHTVYSDGALSPEQNIQWHIANGFNAAVISDHNTAKGGSIAQQIAREKYSDQIKVLVAEEYTCCRLHMNLIFPPWINATGLINSTAWPTDEELQQVINQTHQLGGIASINHIPWSYPRLYDIPTLEQLFSWGLDYVEVVNQGTFDYQSYRYAIENGMGVITGTDMHRPDGGVNGWTTLIPSNFSEEAIFEALKSKQTSFLYNAIASPYSASPQTTVSNYVLDPLFRLGGAISGYYAYETSAWSFNDQWCYPPHMVIFWDQIGIAIVWFAFSFAFFEILRQVFTYLFEKYRKKNHKDHFDSSIVYPDHENEKHSLLHVVDPMKD